MIPLKDDLSAVRPPVLTVGLIAVNVAAFLWQWLVAGIDVSVLRGGLIPFEAVTLRDVGPPDLVPPPLTVFTSMFLHGSFAHIGGNMLFLWIFGNNVEDALGHVRFLAFYLVSGVAAAAAQTGLSYAVGDLQTPMVGASGAIAGVLAGYWVMFPRARILTLIPIFFFIRLVYLPASFFIGAWFVFQLLGAFLGGGGGGVAFMAHIGGFAAGLLLVQIWRPRRRTRGGW
ncbi:MAG TPA: rhomboid family intramembrane serine protease [Anaeromyxobacteraceae bacterium]|nr:rhomboid family intramembrane serine protease [Anaeromyxobacteraceae bacterium]